MLDISTNRIAVRAKWDRAGDRNPHMDEYYVLALTRIFNPILTSLRGTDLLG